MNTNALGGVEPVERFAAKRANFDDPNSRDFEQRGAGTDAGDGASSVNQRSN